MDGSAGCPVGILFDLSEPEPTVTESKQEEKENLVPVTDSKEITRRDSVSECKTEDIDDILKQDIIVKEKSQAPQNSLSDVPLIDEEVFDFDLPPSPEIPVEGGGEVKNRVEDEEVFIGPVGFTEKCIAAGVAEEAIQPLSPLRPDQIAELAKEAYSIAHRISNMKTESKPEDGSPVKSTPSLTYHKKLVSLFRDTAEDHQTSHTHSNKVTENVENVSPRKRTRNGTFTKETKSDSNKVSNSTEKERNRKGTYTKEEPVKNLSASCTTRSGSKEKKGTTEGTGIPQKSGQTTSKMQPPSKLRRYNNSQPNLCRPKPAGAGATGSERKVYDETVPTVARSLQLPKAGGGGGGQFKRRSRGDGEFNKASCQPDVNTTQAKTQPVRIGIRRAHSLTLKSGLSATQRSKLALPSHTSSTAVSAQNAAQKSTVTEAATSTGRKASGIPKGPITKPQLMQPGQLQRRSFAVGQNKKTTSSQRGPLKAPSESRPKMGDTVERPYNPALAAAAAMAVSGNNQCPDTPAVPKAMLPKTLSLSSEASTPAKSSCSSSSVCESTPGSMKKRLSMLPTPSKRRSVAGSLPPPSPMSVGSSRSSVSKRSLASSSDACDSPVFDQRNASRRRVSGASKGSCTSSDVDGPGPSPLAFKPRKPPVQNTPDLPKRTLSRWSPLRKPKPVPLEEQVSMCTKRVTPD